jgi:glycine dehydrogenase
MAQHPTARPALADLERGTPHRDRHLGTTADADRQALLAAVGVASLDELIDRAVPAAIRSRQPLALPPGQPDHEVLADLRALAARNEVRIPLIGLGYHRTVVPPVVQRNVLENPGWYTAYTPYQPEISQGRLEALLVFQTVVEELTGLPVANASLLDEASAAAEAMVMARRLAKVKANRFFVDADTHLTTIAVLETRAAPLGIELVVGPLSEAIGSGAYGALLSSPGSSGALPDLAPIIDALRSTGAVVAVATDLLACCLVTPPGELGADLVIGSAQRFGVPMGFGGPHAGFMACREEHVRSLPGRLVGRSTDTMGRPALRLALQTREQHIRREKATSNICTAQVLLANLSAFYAVWHGPAGLTTIAERVHRLTSALAAGLRSGGVEVVTQTWFDTLTIRVPGRAHQVVATAAERRIDLRQVDDHTVALSLDETTDRQVVEAVWAAFGVSAHVDEVDPQAPSGIPDAMRRTSAFLTQEVFHRYRTEHELLRYLRRLQDLDLALDRTMIPLGSCTMKLNPTVAMLPITWPELAEIHPFAPPETTAGYAELIRRLEAMLAACTGYDAVSLQPNAGSQGELTGLLAIRAYHRSRGDEERTVCLIPSSAHGTNAASAVLAGLDVRVVACNDRGDVDLADLEAKAQAAGNRLAACMVTYPSTHGVFEPGIRDLCEIVHRHGGQVYVDGANLNALVGLVRLPDLGADVSHLNLHKTFAIPHGGGGPGVGPVGVRAHLAPFLPNHPLRADAGPATGIGPVTSAPFGSAGVLPISYAYISLMGGDGLTDATRTAILHANYLARRLAGHYPVLYTGEHGDVAHECILDLRPLTKATGVTAEDVAKRLIDHGFHAPTLSFPVAGTLMVEPTESESLAELDRFVDAMVSIRTEIERVARGDCAYEDSPLHHAPHPAADVATEDWKHGYTRDEAAFPTPVQRRRTYFPPVSRIDAAYGDRHLVCSCAPVEAYDSAN